MVAAQKGLGEVQSLHSRAYDLIMGRDPMTLTCEGVRATPLTTKDAEVSIPLNPKPSALHALVRGRAFLEALSGAFEELGSWPIWGCGCPYMNGLRLQVF